MDFDWKLLLCALGLALILEGLPYFVWAEKMPAFLRYLSSRPPSMLRRLGLAAIAAGFLLLFLGRRL